MPFSKRSCPVSIYLIVGWGMVVGLFVLGWVVPGVGYGENLLSNGGFERVDVDGMPVGWHIFQPTPQARVGVEATQDGYKSRNCLMMESEEQLILLDLYHPPIEMSELGSDQMLFTCYYRTEGEPYPQMSLVTFSQNFYEQEWKTPYLQAEAKDIPSSDQWSLLSWQFEALPGTQQVVPVLRVTGPGKLYIDQVALRPYPDAASATIMCKGALYELPDKRRTTINLTNHSSHHQQLQVVLIAIDPDGGGKRLEKEIRIKPNGSGVLELEYAIPVDSPHTLQLIVRDPDSGAIYEHQQTLAPPLIEAIFTRPAFHNTLLPSIPIDMLEVRGSINAVDSIARQFEVSAELSEMGIRADEQNGGVQRIGPANFVVTLPQDNLLSGEYTVRLKATIEAKGVSHSIRLPLQHLTPSPAEVGYDHLHRLWVNGKPVLPRGLYYVSDAADLQPIAAAGFNFAVVPSTRASYAFAKQAQDTPVSLVISSPHIGRELWENLERKFGQSSALLGWYVMPRPDQKTTPPEVMAEICQHLKTISPAHPTLMSLSSPSLLDNYSSFADIVVAWSLPIPQAPITAVARLVDAAIEASDGRQPVWAAIQAAGPGWYRNEELDRTGSGRAPSPAEMRAMTYLALAHGAKGLIYYGYDIPRYPHTKAFRLPDDAPRLWTALHELNRELQWLAPMILQGERRLLPAVSDGDLHLATWYYDGGYYIVIVNTSGHGVVADFTLPDIDTQRLDVLFEQRSVTRSEGSFQDSFAPHEVHIYTTG